MNGVPPGEGRWKRLRLNPNSCMQRRIGSNALAPDADVFDGMQDQVAMAFEGGQDFFHRRQRLAGCLAYRALPLVCCCLLSALGDQPARLGNVPVGLFQVRKFHGEIGHQRPS
jgi:hypothetical protein